MIDLSPKIKVPDEELYFTFARSSGPGGQNVNKVNSKAIMKWEPEAAGMVAPEVISRFVNTYQNQINNEGFVVISSDKYRDQARNVQDCKDKLSSMLEAVAKPPKKRKPTKPSKGQREERMKQKRQQAEKKGRRRKIEY